MQLLIEEVRMNDKKVITYEVFSRCISLHTET